MVTVPESVIYFRKKFRARKFIDKLNILSNWKIIIMMAAMFILSHNHQWRPPSCWPVRIAQSSGIFASGINPLTAYILFKSFESNFFIVIEEEKWRNTQCSHIVFWCNYILHQTCLLLLKRKSEWIHNVHEHIVFWCNYILPQTCLLLLKRKSEWIHNVHTLTLYLHLTNGIETIFFGWRIFYYTLTQFQHRLHLIRNINY